MQTLEKLPATRPRRKAVTSKAGVRKRGVQSSRGSIGVVAASWGVRPWRVKAGRRRV
jgi:hypothetical protein